MSIDTLNEKEDSGTRRKKWLEERWKVDIEKMEERRNPWKENCEQLDFEIANFIFAPRVSKGSNQAARYSSNPLPPHPFLFLFFFFIQLTNRTGQQEERESNPSDRCDPKLKSIFGRKWSNSCQKLGGSLLERRETLDEKVIYLFGWLRKLVTRGGDLPTWWW